MRRSLIAAGIAAAATFGLAAPAHADSYGPFSGTTGVKLQTTSATANNFQLAIPVSLTTPCRWHYTSTKTVKECQQTVVVAYDSAGKPVGVTDEDMGKKPGKATLYIYPELISRYGTISVHSYNAVTEKLGNIQRMTIRASAKVTASGTRSGAVLTVKGTATRYLATQFAFKGYPSAKVMVQRLVSGKWTTVAQTTAKSNGSYSVKVRKPKGTFRTVISSTASYTTATSTSFTR